MVNPFLFILIGFAVLVLAQAQSGFLSIDCGIPDDSTYTDNHTNINYVSDAKYIQTSNGISNTISSLSQTDDLARQFFNLRSFPEGSKNCYSIPYPSHKVGSRFLVRARFMYGNYDSRNIFPTFDLYFGSNFWATIEFDIFNTIIDKEILYIPRNSSDREYVCLINTNNGTPFISALEIRLINTTAYEGIFRSETLQLSSRWDFKTYQYANLNIIRYPDDTLDRIWEPWSQFDHESINTTSIITPDGYFMIPSSVMTTAITPVNASDTIIIYTMLEDSTAGCYIYMHFADFQSKLTRRFDIITNNDHTSSSDMSTKYLSITSLIIMMEPVAPTVVSLSLIKNKKSDLPPIINAMEIYIVRKFSNQLTNKDDVNAIQNIKMTYGLKRDWQRNPCLPVNFTWKSIGCFNKTDFDDPRIVLLNLSKSGLTGKISPYIFDLKRLQHLDLSNNDLNGEVPEFLSEMEYLEILLLSGNNLSGVIPPKLITKSNNGLMRLSYDRNPYLCSSGPCKMTPIPTPIPTPNPPPIPTGVIKKKCSKLPIIIGAVAALFAVVAIIFMLVWLCAIRKKNSESNKDVINGTYIERDGPVVAQRQNYTYAEVTQMTNNFQKELGKGGFGSVYHGSIDETQVAVKMLSPSSAQGYKQFKAEAELLMRVHHRNLTRLVGYCDEGDKLGLIYEFMANGDVQTHLSDLSIKCMSWELRLEIMLDAAQGLEYLHHGCKPPIIHRDIKTTNILLNEEMQAKIADFGLSKAFPTDGGTHVSTAFAGTPGYFDPEYNINEASDVYSFGVVLLEVLTGKPPILEKDKERAHLSQWVSQTLEERGDVRNVVDPRLSNDFDVNSVWKVVDVAMVCVSHFSAQRPLMKDVVIELTMCLGMEKARKKDDDKSKTNNELSEYSPNIDISNTNPIAR